MGMVDVRSITSDTCQAFGEYLQAPANTTLDDLLPCVDANTASSASSVARQGVDNIILQANNAVTQIRQGSAQVGRTAELPNVCDPIGPAPTYTYTSQCPAGTVPIGQLPQVSNNSFNTFLIEKPVIDYWPSSDWLRFGYRSITEWLWIDYWPAIDRSVIAYRLAIDPLRIDFWLNLWRITDYCCVLFRLCNLTYAQLSHFQTNVWQQAASSLPRRAEQSVIFQKAGKAYWTSSPRSQAWQTVRSCTTHSTLSWPSDAVLPSSRFATCGSHSCYSP